MTDVQYSASCPVCGYEHDFPTKRAMDAAWSKWRRRILSLVTQRSQVAR